MLQPNKFQEIKKDKTLGRTINQTARHLNISRPTVKKYWDTSYNEFMKMSEKEKRRKKKSRCDKYKSDIIEMIKDVNEIQASTIYDRLLESYGELDFEERTLRRYVKKLREVIGIPKTPEKRNYQAADETGPGEQAQVDFGEFHLRCAWDPTKRKKVYFFVMVLRYSRFKYVELSDTKFTAEMAIEAHKRAFDYFGGIPRQIVYDQDSVFIVSENKGEIIETHQFKSFLANMPFSHYVARGADPETKGCIEKYVGFVKKNFLFGRLFKNIDTLNSEALSWLERTGNTKVCQAINKRPTDRIEEERQALFPTHRAYKDPEVFEIIPHKINKDNTVTYRGNRYRVPNGTYNSQRNHEVGVMAKDGQLFIVDLTTRSQIINHPISEGKGRLVGEREEKPLSQSTFNKVVTAVSCFSPYQVDPAEFFERLSSRYTRYLPEQMDEIISAFKENEGYITKEAVADSLRICMESFNFSANEFKRVLTNHCDLLRMDKAVEEQRPASRMEEIAEVLTEYYNPIKTAENESESKLLSMWEELSEGKE